MKINNNNSVIEEPIVDTVAQLERINQALAAFKEGEFVIIRDDEGRENEGDLCLPAQFCTPEKVNFILSNARGEFCVSVDDAICKRLELNQQVSNNTAQFGTGFTVTVDWIHGGTGVSVTDRASTARALANPNTKPSDLARPGHVHPVHAMPGGVFKRVGQTEGSTDLARLAGLEPAVVMVEILAPDGTMLRGEALEEYAKNLGCPLISIADLIHYRMTKERWIKRIDQAKLPTSFGYFDILAYETLDGSESHIALTKGEILPDKPVLVRMHSECLTGDALTSMRCDCRDQLHHAMKEIQKEDVGVLVYLRQEGRGIGLVNKIRAYHLQDLGLDTVDANLQLGFPVDKRDYGVGAQILRDLNVTKIKLMTNNPKKLIGLRGYGLEIVERVQMPFDSFCNTFNSKYIKTKHDRLGHLDQ